uniref:Uncharacterized protein n=1 Tax=Apteryx owenii TaxID=8824 RepID=A0A8B9S8B4_APTOW
PLRAVGWSWSRAAWPGLSRWRDPAFPPRPSPAEVSPLAPGPPWCGQRYKPRGDVHAAPTRPAASTCPAQRGPTSSVLALARGASARPRPLLPITRLKRAKASEHQLVRRIRGNLGALEAARRGGVRRRPPAGPGAALWRPKNESFTAGQREGFAQPRRFRQRCVEA